MALQNFVNQVGPPIGASWLNGVDVAINQTLGGGATPSAVLTALGLEAPFAVTNGGTGATTASQALANLGGTTLTAVKAAINQTFIGEQLYPQTTAEQGAGVTPTNYVYPFGDLRRYGGDPTGVADSSTAWQSALSCAYAIIAQGCKFKIVTPATFTGAVTIVGFGASSQLLCDGLVATISSGTGSVVDNFAMLNITAPYVLSRNPNSWGTTITTLSQSNTVLGYQPTPNDPEYVSLSATYPSITTQNIGPALIFSGNATNIEVSRIYGRFVSLMLYDAQFSSVHDCDFRGGKNLGGIVFWNINNQIGEGNKAYENRVQYASYSGVMMSRNFDFEMSDNTCLFNGESGVKTFQDTQAGVDARCYKGLIADNVCNYNYFDGVDAFSCVGTSTPLARYMKVSGNYSFGNGGNGINIDGSLNEVSDNWIGFNYRYGIWSSGTIGLAFSSVKNNHLYDNNQGRSNTTHDISITGNAAYATAYSGGYGYTVGALASSGGVAYRCIQTTSGNAPPNASYWVAETPGANHIESNYVYAGPLQNNYGIYAPDTNFVADNIAVNAAVFFFGNVGTVSAVVEDVVDGASGNTGSQSFTLQILNTAGVMQHLIASDNGAAVQNLLSSRIIGCVNTAQNTPTGTDSSTAFAYGGKISSANTNYFILNTMPQNPLYFDMIPVITVNSCGTALCCSLNLYSINVNGVSYLRPCLVFTNATSGAAFPLTTANIANGKVISVALKGKLA